MKKRIAVFALLISVLVLSTSCTVIQNLRGRNELLAQFRSDSVKVKKILPNFWHSYGQAGFASDLSKMLDSSIGLFEKKYPDESIICFFIYGSSMSKSEPKAFILSEKHLYILFFRDAFSSPKYGLKRIFNYGKNDPYIQDYLEILKQYSNENGGWDEWIAMDQPLAYVAFRKTKHDKYHGFFYEYHGIDESRFLKLNLFVEKILGEKKLSKE